VAIRFVLGFSLYLGWQLRGVLNSGREWSLRRHPPFGKRLTDRNRSRRLRECERLLPTSKTICGFGKRLSTRGSLW
jgi:hypothetical protein